jgi:stage III sporulation protein AD
VFSVIKDVSEEAEIGEYIVVLFKALGISYIAIITSDICRSSGEEILANAAQTAGKFEILSLSLPLAIQLIETAKEML